MSQIREVAAAAIRLRTTAVVDDDFPEMMHKLDEAIHRYELSPPLPKIVCLCGSTRFRDEFTQANYRETMSGNIVLSVGFFGTHGSGESVGCTSEEKVALDVLHKRKIDLADEILVLNVEGYIGDSTRSEIEYARATGKPVRYLVDPY